MIETWTHFEPFNGFEWKKTNKILYIKHTEYIWICSQRNTWMWFRCWITQKLQSELHKQQCIAAYVITTEIIQHHNGIMTRIYSFVLNSQQQLTPLGFVTCLDTLLWWCGNNRPKQCGTLYMFCMILQPWIYISCAVFLPFTLTKDFFFVWNTIAHYQHLRTYF